MAKKKTAENQEFAVIETGGKQYKVSVGDVITVESLKETRGKDAGEKLVFDKVLLVDNGSDTTIGLPHIKGAKVEASLFSEKKGPKIKIMRYKAKSNRSRRQGHRQPQMQIKIEKIS